jgi:hypothetical protein
VPLACPRPSIIGRHQPPAVGYSPALNDTSQWPPSCTGPARNASVAGPRRGQKQPARGSRACRLPHVVPPDVPTTMPRHGSVSGMSEELTYEYAEVIVGFVGRGPDRAVLPFMRVLDVTGRRMTPDFAQGPTRGVEPHGASGMEAPVRARGHVRSHGLGMRGTQDARRHG